MSNFLTHVENKVGWSNHLIWLDVKNIQISALSEGFYRVCCVLHQLDIVVQKCITSYFNNDFYIALPGLIGTSTKFDQRYDIKMS